MGRERLWKKLWKPIVLGALSGIMIALLVVGIKAYILGFSYNEDAHQAVMRSWDIENEFLDEIERQIDYNESHPFDTTLSSGDFIAIVLKERKDYLVHQEIIRYQSASSTFFAISAFSLASVGCLLVITGWVYTYRKKIEITKPQKGTKTIRTKGRKNIRKHK